MIVPHQTLEAGGSLFFCKIELSIDSPCLWQAFTPYPLFQWYLQSNEILLNLNMKCWNSAFNAQGSRVITVVVWGTSENICSSSVEELRKKERQDETKFTTKIGGKTRLGSRYFVL